MASTRTRCGTRVPAERSRRAPRSSRQKHASDADFDGLLVDWKQKGHTLVVEGREAFNGWSGFKLKLTTKGGVVRYIYVDTTSYLDRRHTGTVNLPAPANAPAGSPPRQYDFVSDFSDWKIVDGVKFPFAVDEDRGGATEPAQSFATYTEKIETNVPLEDLLFAPPAAPAGGNVRIN